MKIGINGTSLIPPITGVGKYTLELCRELNNLLPEATFIVFCQKQIDLPCENNRWELHVNRIPLFGALWVKFILGILCNKKDVEIFWSPSPRLPYFFKNGIRTFVTVHDLVHILFPGSMIFKHMVSNRLFFKKDILNANYIFSNSNSTSIRLKSHFGREANFIVKPGVGDIYKPIKKEIIILCLSKYNINSPYMMTLSTKEPRKNFETLVESFIELKNENILKNELLVLVGGKGWNVKNLNINQRKDILELGYVPEDDLPALYSGAEIFIFPSLYEGYGMPAAEAMACGTPVLTSDIPELMEATKNIATYIAPTKEGIKEGVITLLKNNKIDYQSDLNYVKSKWDESAKIMVEAFKTSMKN